MNSEIRYKLRMKGVPIMGPTNIRCDNMSVVRNTSVPESVIHKKDNSEAYHCVREQVAMRSQQVAFETSETNLADMLTKIQSGPRRQMFAQNVLY